jgi:hypothetical protein
MPPLHDPEAIARKDQARAWPGEVAIEPRHWKPDGQPSFRPTIFHQHLREEECPQSAPLPAKYPQFTNRDFGEFDVQYQLDAPLDALDGIEPAERGHALRRIVLEDGLIGLPLKFTLQIVQDGNKAGNVNLLGHKDLLG